MRCHTPTCGFLVHSDPQFGGYCCMKCHWRWKHMSTCKGKHGEYCEKVVAPHSALVAPDLAPDWYPAHTPVTTATPPQPTAPIGTGASDTMSSQNLQKIADLKTVAAAARAEGPWLPALPPLPHVLYEQLQQAQTSLAQKDKTLVEKDQKLKLYGELIAALQGENSNLKLLVQEMKERGDRYQAGLSHVTKVLQEMKEGVRTYVRACVRARVRVCARAVFPHIGPAWPGQCRLWPGVCFAAMSVSGASRR